MPTLRQHLALRLLALIGASAPVAAYTGYYAPACGYATVWSLSGCALPNMCF